MDQLDKMLSAEFLFTSLWWGSIGSGFFIYGWKQKSPLPLTVGAVLCGASFFVTTWWLMWLICVAVLAAAWGLKRQGY